MDKLKLKEKMGYAFGDVGCGMIFAIIAGFLQIFYTDALFLDPKQIIVIFIVARIWDAINDPLLGTFIDSRPPLKKGKYRSYMRYFSYPLTIFVIICFTQVSSLPSTGTLIYAYITYIIYGMLYTCVNIPYGALASAMTSDEVDRSDLSFFRSIGSGIGGIPAAVILPMVVMTKVITDSQEVQILDANKLLISVAILAVVSLLFIQISTFWTKERIQVEYKPISKEHIIKTFKTLLTNKAFISISICSMLIITIQMFNTAQQLILFRNYFGKAELFSLVTLAAFLPMGLLLPVLSKLIKKYGKKELCSYGMILASIASLILFLIRTTNPYVFLFFTFLIGSGSIIIIVQIWAFAGDVIDYQQYLHGSRDEATTYAFFSFARKLGHTMAGVFAPLTLALSNYYVDPVTQISTVDTELLYTWTTLLPTIMYVIIFLLLRFVYPIDKQMVLTINDKLFGEAANIDN